MGSPHDEVAASAVGSGLHHRAPNANVEADDALRTQPAPTDIRHASWSGRGSISHIVLGSADRHEPVAQGRHVHDDEAVVADVVRVFRIPSMARLQHAQQLREVDVERSHAAFLRSPSSGATSSFHFQSMTAAVHGCGVLNSGGGVHTPTGQPAGVGDDQEGFPEGRPASGGRIAGQTAPPGASSPASSPRQRRRPSNGRFRRASSSRLYQVRMAKRLWVSRLDLLHWLDLLLPIWHPAGSARRM